MALAAYAYSTRHSLHKDYLAALAALNCCAVLGRPPRTAVDALVQQACLHGDTAASACKGHSTTQDKYAFHKRTSNGDTVPDICLTCRFALAQELCSTCTYMGSTLARPGQRASQSSTAAQKRTI